MLSPREGRSLDALVKWLHMYQSELVQGLETADDKVNIVFDSVLISTSTI